MVSEHLEMRTLHDVAVDPDHADRRESEIFRKAKERLKEDGHFKCYICGSTKSLQVHHRAVEYMFENIADFEKVKEFCEEWDLYGYGRLLKAQPITTVDDIRCQMVLCQEHHTGIDHENGGSGTGIHDLTFPSWIAQKLCVTPPIPQRGENSEQAMARIKEHERR